MSVLLVQWQNKLFISSSETCNEVKCKYKHTSNMDAQFTG